LIRDTVRRDSLCCKTQPFAHQGHKADRFRWTCGHAYLTEDDWRSALWTDEGNFTIFGNGKRCKMVSRRKDEACRYDYLQPTAKFGGKLRIVWGCFAANGVGTMHEIGGFMDHHVYLQAVKNVGLQSANTLLGCRYTWPQFLRPQTHFQ